MCGGEMLQESRGHLCRPTGSPERIGRPGTLQTPRPRVRRSAKGEAGKPQIQVLTTKSGQIRRAQKGFFVHYCDICKKGPYSRREHLNRHKQRHIEPTRECAVCGKRFQQDDFLQQHMQNMHPNLVELPRDKSKSSVANGSNGVQTESRLKLQRSRALRPADLNWPSCTGQFVSTAVDSDFQCISSATVNGKWSCAGDHEALVHSFVKSDTKLDQPVTFIPNTPPRIGSVKPCSLRQTSTPSNEALLGIPSSNLSGRVEKRSAFHWPFSQCPDLGTALLRGLVHEFSSVYGKEWMGDLFGIKSRQNGIDQSLFAVTAMWQSKLKNDSPLRQRAITAYQGAILNVRAQLNSSRLNDPLVLVATSMIFAATEAQVDDGADQVGWITHIKGALAVLRVTDPQMWASPRYIRLYVDLRYMSLLLFLGVRRPFFMSGKEWKCLVWPRSSRTTRESLIDELVDLPELLSICSTLEKKLEKNSTAVNETDLSQGWHLLRAFKQFEMRLDLWREGLEKCQGSSLYWRHPSPNPMPLSSTDEVPVAICFADPLTAESITLYWAALLIIYLSALDIYNLIRFHMSNEAVGSKVPGQTYLAFSHNLEAYEIPEESDARKLANQLGQSLEYLNGAAFKPLNGARLACVPLWPAMRFFVRFPGPELSWVQKVAQNMSEKTGLQYVSKIASNPVDIFMQNAERNG